MLDGILDWAVWPWGYASSDSGGDWESNGEFTEALYDTSKRKKLVWSDKIEDDVRNRISFSIELLRLPETLDELFNSFLDYDFPGRWAAAQSKRRKKRT